MVGRAGRRKIDCGRGCAGWIGGKAVRGRAGGQALRSHGGRTASLWFPGMAKTVSHVNPTWQTVILHCTIWCGERFRGSRVLVPRPVQQLHHRCRVRTDAAPSLTKRLVNHAQPNDVTQGYTANWTIAWDSGCSRLFSHAFSR